MPALPLGTRGVYLMDTPARDRRYHDGIAQVYFERWELPIQRLTRRLESRWLRRLLKDMDRPSVLLAGSGGGREVEALLPLGASVCAVDYSGPALEAGRRRWGTAVEWHLGDVHDLSEFPAGSFDVAVSLSAFNYFVDPPLALRRMTSRLRPGGLLVVSSLNAEHPTEGTLESKVTRTPFTRDELVEMGRAAGLDRLRTRGHRVAIDRITQEKHPRLFWVTLQTEPLLGWVAGARRCKWMWLIARRRP